MSSVTAAAALPARGQRTSVRTIGYLDAGSRASRSGLIAPFLKGLAELGYVENKNLIIEYRWGGGQFERLPQLAADLVRQHVALIAAFPAPAALAAKAATTEIPIVFMSGPNPVTNGLVSSLRRPGGNVTGVTTITSELAPKRLQLLRDIAPKAVGFAFLVNSRNPRAKPDTEEVRAAARLAGEQVLEIGAATLSEIQTALGTFAQQRVGALLIGADPYFYSVRKELAEVTTRYSMPAIFSEREYAAAGGLMSYGASLDDAHYRVGRLVGRILNGDRPIDLPVQQPLKFELVINLRAARAIGINLPETLLLRADEVIQ